MKEACTWNSYRVYVLLPSEFVLEARTTRYKTFWRSFHHGVQEYFSAWVNKFLDAVMNNEQVKDLERAVAAPINLYYFINLHITDLVMMQQIWSNKPVAQENHLRFSNMLFWYTNKT